MMPKRKKLISSKIQLRDELRESRDAKGLIFPWFSGIIERLFSLSKEMADNSNTKVQQTAEKKEKLPKVEVQKFSPETFVNESLDKQEVNSNFEVQQKNLSAEVLEDKKKAPQEKEKSGAVINVVAEKVGFSKEERETLAKYNQEWGDETKLQKRLDNLESLQKDGDKLKGFLGKKGSKGIPESELFDRLLDKYTVRDSGGSRFYSFEEVIGESESTNPFKKLWMIITHPMEYFKYMQIKKRFEKELLLCRTGREIGGKIKEKVDKGVHLVREAKEGVRNVMDPLKENPATKTAVRSLTTKFKEQSKLIFKHGRKVSPDQIAHETKTLMNQISREGIEKGKGSFYKAVQKGKMPGFTIKTTGKYMVIEVLSRGLLDAIRSGSLGNFPETISNSNIWIEAIPGVGSFKSVKRLFTNNGDPLWAKLTEAGVNLVGDGILIAGIVGSVVTFGASGAAGVAGRAALVSGAKGLIKKQVLKQSLKNVAEKGITKVATKEGRKELAKGALKGSGKALKGSGKVALQTGKFTLTMSLLEEAFQRFFPTEKVTTVATNIALDQLNPQQRRLVDMGIKAKKAI